MASCPRSGADKLCKQTPFMTSMTQHMEVYKVAGMVADKKLADIELDIVADMEVEKVADKFKTKCIKPEMF